MSEVEGTQQNQSQLGDVKTEGENAPINVKVCGLLPWMIGG